MPDFPIDDDPPPEPLPEKHTPDPYLAKLFDTRRPSEVPIAELEEFLAKRAPWLGADHWPPDHILRRTTRRR